MSEISLAAEESSRKQMLVGVGTGAIAYLIWGLNVMYYKLLVHTDPYEVLAQRMLWSVVFAVILVLALGRMRVVLSHLRNSRTIWGLTITGFLINSSWFLYLWLVHQSHVMQASLGQFIIPLGSVLTGILLLRERPPMMQLVALGLATSGVVYFTIMLGFIPWMGLYIPLSFVLYTYIRKTMQVDSLDGLLIEMTLMLPFALAYIAYKFFNGGNDFFSYGVGTALLMIGTGPITAIPLLLFVISSKHVSMTLMGFMQYLVPSMTFLLAVFLYHEPLTRAHMVTFGLIWLGLAIFTTDMVRRERALRAAAAGEVG